MLPAQPFRNAIAQARLGVSQQEHENFFRTMLAEVDDGVPGFRAAMSWLGALAIAMASRQYAAHQMNASALMRVLGLTQAQLILIHGSQLLALTVACVLGGLACGWLGQQGLMWALSSLLPADLPPAGWMPAALAAAAGAGLMLAFAASPAITGGPISAGDFRYAARQMLYFSVALGIMAGYFGGWIDLALQRVMDILMAFPLIIMALAVVAIFGTGVHNVIAAITIPLIPRCARVVRASALAIREVPYIDAARTSGFSHARIILRHMVPNVVAPFLIMLTAFVGQAILAEASLSYLGLGVQEPTPAWGLMLQGGAEEYATSAPWIAIFPGVAIMLSVLGINLFGDALRDTLDPKLRNR